jgi:hypothetical protein
MILSTTNSSLSKSTQREKKVQSTLRPMSTANLELKRSQTNLNFGSHSLATEPSTLKLRVTALNFNMITASLISTPENSISMLVSQEIEPYKS